MKSYVFCFMSFVLVASASAQLLQRNRPLAARPAAAAAPQPSAAPAADADVGGRSIEFNAAPLEMVFKVYQDLVGKTVLKDPQTPAVSITLQPKKGQELTDEDKIEAIETVLEMNGVHMEPYGEKFVRAIPRQSARKAGIPLILDEDVLPNTEKVVSTMIRFKNLPDINEAQKALEGFKSEKGQLQVFERTRSILVTDTQMNINRMREIAKEIDQPNPPMGMKRYERTFKYATAANIEKALTACYEFSKAEEEERKGKSPTGAQQAAQQPANNRPIFPSRLLGRPGQQPQKPADIESLFIGAAMSDRALVRGRPLFIYDEENVPNKLIIVTYPENMELFDWVIEQLDVETTPDTVVKVYRLKYAEAEEVSDMINDLIGSSASSKNSSKTQNKAQSSSAGKTSAGSASKKPANQRTGDVKAGELNKENTTVLADKRINGLVVMTQKELVPTVEQIIESMDIKLSQVLIETVIIEVTLGDGINTGVDWVRYNKNGANGMSRRSGDGYALGGGGGSGAKALAGFAVSNTVDYLVNPTGSGINYFLKSDSLNLAAIISASKNDDRSKYIASPVVMTVDNKEATIEATESRKFYSGSTSSSSGSFYGSVSYNYSDKDLGIKIKVTPKINPNGTVMLEVEEEYSQLGAGQSVLVSSGTSSGAPSKETVDTALQRKMSADILLENGQTVVLGGLTETKTVEKETGIPVLKNIPIVGKWLFGKVENSEDRKELLVFMTPYVLDDAVAAQAEAIRRKKSLSDVRPWDDHGWSASSLADPVDKKEQMRRIKDEWKKQDEERKTKYAIEKMKVERAKKLQAMSADERAQWLLMHKEELEKEAQEELEEKMLDAESQEELKKLAEQVRAQKLAEAEVEIKAAEKETAAENERAKLDAAKKAKEEAKEEAE